MKQDKSLLFVAVVYVALLIIFISSSMIIDAYQMQCAAELATEQMEVEGSALYTAYSNTNQTLETIQGLSRFGLIIYIACYIINLVKNIIKDMIRLKQEK